MPLQEYGMNEELASSETGLVVPATVARVMATLLSAKPKKLQEAISRLHSSPQNAPLAGSLEHSLWFLHNYVKEAAETGEHLDLVILPIVQNSLSTRESKHGNRELILLNLLFQDDFVFQAVIKNMASIIFRRDDRYMAVGWCIVGRNLIESEDNATNSSTAIKEKRTSILKTFCSCVSHLVSIICNGSIMKEGFELPTRLAVAAADFILSLTVALTKKELTPNITAESQKSLPFHAKILPVNPLVSAADDSVEQSSRTASELPFHMELAILLWNSLNEIITIVKKITAWSKRSRFLHSTGLERVLRWLQELKEHHDPDRKPLKTSALLLASCWKHYGALLQLEDHKFSYQYKDLLQQYLSGMQFYADYQFREPNVDIQGISKTKKFFLNCLLLLFGRLDTQQFEDALTEFGSKVSQILVSELQSGDDEVIDGAFSMLKALFFGTNHTSSSIVDPGRLDAFLPILLNLLDERDTAAKAIVQLIAEYCSRCPRSNCLDEIFECLKSKNAAQRMNAVDVLADLIHYHEGSSVLPPEAWHGVINHLFGCLGDDDAYIRNQSVDLISMIEPPAVLPTLVCKIYSANEIEQISAKRSLIALLGYHKEEPETLCLLLDFVSEFSQSQAISEPALFDADKILKLLSEWTRNVEYWRKNVGPLIDKMFSEPSNPVIVRFLSLISEYLAEAVDVVFHRLMLHMREEKGADSKSEAMMHENCPFNRISPLLLIRLLPIGVFDDLNSCLLYGNLSRSSGVDENGSSDIEVADCIADWIINRAMSQSEFKDGRKLAAELCGRIHPKVLIPILCTQLRSAINTNDVLKTKVCLFSLCTSLVVRGADAFRHPDIMKIRKQIQKVLSWPSSESDEVVKAQHGCIDCLALMLCIEVQDPAFSKGAVTSRGSVLEYVMRHLSTDGKGTSKAYSGIEVAVETYSLSFRLCMANVLISACQKIPESGKRPFVTIIVPRVISSLKATQEPEIKASCVQVLFSVAYHMKSWILLCSNELVSVALRSLREGSSKEKIAGAKLLAGLIAGEEEVVESISPALIQAKALLHDLLSCSADGSPELGPILSQLLACLSPC